MSWLNEKYANLKQSQCSGLHRYGGGDGGVGVGWGRVGDVLGNLNVLLLLHVQLVQAIHWIFSPFSKIILCNVMRFTY